MVKYGAVQSIDANKTLLHEIDRRKQAEQALLECEKMHRRLFEGAPSGIVVLDQAENILTINPNMTAMSGYALNEWQVLGMDAFVVSRSKAPSEAGNVALMHQSHMGSHENKLCAMTCCPGRIGLECIETYSQNPKKQALRRFECSHSALRKRA